MGQALSVDVQMVTITCSCGGVYAITEGVREHHQAHGTCWHCPYCETGWGFHKSEAAKLREQLEVERAETQRQRDRAEATQRSNVALRGQATRLRKRIANGVCPCCNRSFADLRAHMVQKHPKYAETEVGA